MADRLHRTVPIRAMYVLACVLVYAFAVTMQARTGVDSTVLAQVVLGILGVAIGADTYRPSGYSHATTAVDISELLSKSTDEAPSPAANGAAPGDAAP